MITLLRMLLVGVSTVFLLCGGTLWMRRHEGGRSRLFLTYTWMLVGLVFLTRLVAGRAGVPVAERVLPVENLMGGLCVIMLLYLYPLESIHSGWFNRRHVLLYFLPGLARLLHTNRNYVSRAIQHCGYKNFSDLMNRKRIAEFLKLADAGRVVSVQDTFFYVGFRSRETALRCFKKYVGMLPTDYLRSRMVPKSTVF